MKTCKKCNSQYDGRRCHICNSRITTEWILKNKQRVSENRKRLYRETHPNPRKLTDLSLLTKEEKDTHRKHSRIKSVYGITKDEWNSIMESQNHKCAICGFSDTKNKRFFPLVDHCHKSQKVRGILCMTCNSGLGSFKDNIELLKNAISYLTHS